MNVLPEKSNQIQSGKVTRTGLRIDMTPMVDVAMLLLTFFMLTTVFNKPQAIELNLPESQTPVPIIESKIITIYIDSNSKIYTQNGINGNIFGITLNKLRSELCNIKRNKPDVVAIIKIDRRAKYERMVDILDELNISSIGRLSIIHITEKDLQKLKEAALMSDP